MLTLNSEHPSSADKFERKFQAKISPYEQSIEKPEKELTPFEKYLEESQSEIKAMNNNIVDMIAKIHNTMSVKITWFSSKNSENIHN